MTLHKKGSTNKMNNDKLNEKFKEELKEISHVNIMVVGGTGVGKSSLINTVFLKEIAKVGNGKPVTKGIVQYKSPDMPIVVFDTEGYEIIDGAIDNSNFEQNVMAEIRKRQQLPLKEQIHLYWYCISAGNHRITEYDLSNIRQLTKLGVKLAIIITQCDSEEVNDFGEGITSQSFRTILREEGIKNVVFETSTTMGSTALQLPELVTWSQEELPTDDLKALFISAQKANLVEKDNTANKAILTAIAAATAAGGANPLPLSDGLVIAPIQMKLAVSLAKIYGFTNLGSNVMTLLQTQVVGLVGRQVAASLTKLIPVVGQLVNATVAGGITAGIGYGLQKLYREAYIAYLETGKEPDWAKLFAQLDLTSLFNKYLPMISNK